MAARTVAALVEQDSGAHMRWSAWLRKAALAVTDQGLISGANMVCTIVLARWMGPEGYGNYVLAFSAYMLVSAIQQALVLEPMSVLGPVMYGGTQKPYLRSLLWVHGGLTLVFSVALFAAAAIANAISSNGELANALYGLAIGAPFILLLGMLRSACYLRYDVRIAAAAAVMYAVLFISGVAGMHALFVISPFSVFVLMSAVSIVVSLIMIPHVMGGATVLNQRIPLREVCREHWRYGRWALGSSAVSWAWENSWYILSGALLSMREVGGLRSAGNLLLPVAHIAAACGRLAQPYVSAIAGKGDAARLVASVRRMGILFTAVAALYCIGISVFDHTIFARIYGPRFAPFASLFPWIGLNYVLTIASQSGFGIGLRALQSPASVFSAYAGGAAIATILSIPAAHAYRLPGIVGASIVASIFSLTMSAYLFRMKMRSRSRELAVSQN